MAPLGAYVAADLQLSLTVMGALTTLPVLMLALGGVLGAWIIARLGAKQTLVAAIVMMALGSMARAVSLEAGLLLGMTALMGLGLAIMQTVLPTLVRAWTPQLIALSTALYMNGLLMGEVLAAGFTLPVVMPLVNESWRWSIVVWSLPPLLIAWMVMTLTPNVTKIQTIERRNWLPNFKDPLVWSLGLVMGCSSTLFFGLNAYMSVLLESRQEGDWVSISLLVFNSAQVAASFLTLKYAARWVGQARPLLLATLLALMSTLWFGLGWGWTAIVAGFMVSLATGVVLILMVSLPPFLTRSEYTAALTAGMFTVGYGLAFLLPTLGGWMVDQWGDARWVLVPMLAIAMLSLPAILVVVRAFHGSLERSPAP
jgi:CP family cyanate transporter-like MFS transporter